MAFFEKNKDKIWSKYTLKRTKLHRFKKIYANSQIWKKKISPPPPKSWGRPCIILYTLIAFGLQTALTLFSKLLQLR